MKTISLRFLLLFTILIWFSHCNNSDSVPEKKPILLADREAPVGWTYLRIYEDSTFEFSDTKYQGKVIINNDTLIFQYENSVPKVGKIAIIKEDYIIYTGGLREELEIKLNKLKK
jgi:hypothetical protein